MGLDWELPSYSPAGEDEPPPLQVKVELGRAFEFLPGADRTAIGLSSFLLALNPFNYEAYWQRGRAYGRQREPTKAIADYSMALALLLPGDPRRAQLLLRRAHNYRTLQDKARAVADLHQLVSMELGDFSGMHAELAMVCNDMAWQLVTGPEKNRDPARALPLAQKAVALLPELSIHHLNTLGVVHYRLGEYRQAAEVLERSLRENGAAPFYDLIFLAMSYARLGDAAKASEYYDRAAARIGEPHAMLGAGTKAEQDAFWAEARAVLGKDDRR
jgi:tetratricopeptide (TPR) repeat protein